MVAALQHNLSEIRPDPTLSQPTLLSERLALGSRCSIHQSTFVMLPAAVGERDGTLSMHDSDVSLITGGKGHGDAIADIYDVAQVDFSAWLRASFTLDDFVVLKMDVEGGEHKIVPKMVSDGSIKLVDVWLWECHMVPKWWNSKCHRLKKILKDNGVKTLYEDPYPW